MNPVVLYDGDCGLCSKSVRWLIDHDPGHTLRYAPLQGETAAQLRTEHPSIPQTIDTVVFVDHGRVYLRTKALFRVTRYLTSPWRWAWHLRWIPAFLLDLGYRVVAKARYRIWGKNDACDLPAPAERALFLP